MIDWDWITQSEKWLYEFNVELTETIVEYEGPSIAIFTDDSKKQYLGIFCDFTNKLYRWMLAPVSGAEVIAIHTGAVALLDVFKKRTIWFCDFNDSYHSLNTWHAGFERIPGKLLPKRGKTIPSFAIKPISEFVQVGIQDAIIKLDGRSVVHNSVPFRELGKFLVQFQDYWERLSRSSMLKSLAASPVSDPHSFTSLSFCAASEGSVNIHFKPTSELGKGQKYINTTLTKMASIDESGVSKKLATELGQVGINNANSMYSLMHSTGIDMLIVTHDKCLFLGSEKAGRVARSITKAKKQKINNLILRGHFCAGRNKKSTHSFEFTDESNGKSYKGKLSPLVWKYNAIAVGPSEYYEVEIETFERKKVNQPTEMLFTLIRADKIRRPMIVEE